MATIKEDGHHAVSDILQRHRDVDSILAHFGVKGMKWGVRRKRGKDGRVSPKDLDDETLKAAVARMQLERQYTQLSAGRDRSVAAAGATFVKGAVAQVARQQALNLANQAVSNAIQAKIKKK